MAEKLQLCSGILLRDDGYGIVSTGSMSMLNGVDNSALVSTLRR